jgi:deoxyribodipyrimidine photo-lyase
LSTAIVWFRQDLRCNENPALAEACNQHELIIPVYIYSRESLGAAQNWWLHHSLFALQNELKKLGLDLYLQQGKALPILNTLVQKYEITAIYWNRCYEPQNIQRDTQIKEALKAQSIQVYSFNGSLLNEPWTIKNQQGDFFKVFTPYWKYSLRHIIFPEIPVIPPGLTTPTISSEHLDDWQLLPKRPDWAQGFNPFWEPGEQGAQHKLQQFIEHQLYHYKKERDYPNKAATSYLSPHLHFGEISPWQIGRALTAAKLQNKTHLSNTECFLAELGWREFSYYLLYHFPKLPQQNFRPEFAAFPWQNDQSLLQSWQKGMTGFPIVDAGMRELWHTGYMHNRIRMIVASFLIKDLLIDWREGARWFLNTLLDADLANNSANWQWVAGTGADAAPYFRIFNPTLQGEKFDPHGAYVKQWIPELSQVPNQWIHKPWEAPPNTLPITLGKDYPLPIVNHATARAIALHYYQSIKNKAQPKA